MSDQKPEFDRSKLKQSQLQFIKLIEAQNLDRANTLRALKKRNFLTGGLIGLGVVSIYAYSILAVRQETFLDDFDEPAKTSK